MDKGKPIMFTTAIGRITRLALLSVLSLGAVVSGAEVSPSPSPNLLRNSGFLQCANPGIPDWWGTGGAEKIQEWPGCYGTTAEAPFPGVQSLRLRVPPAASGIAVQSYAYPLPSGRDYTFSLYLKADVTDLRVGLAVGDQSRTVSASQEWQRVVFTATPKQGHWAGGRLVVRCAAQGVGTLWMAAPQLEYGSVATAYRAAAADSATAAAAGPVIPPQPVPLPVAECQRLAAAPTIDGLLSDPCYKEVTWFTAFRDMASGEPSRIETESVICRDRANLYIAFRCHEPEMSGLVAKATRRDGAVFGDDSVEVFLQPEPASSEYLHFAVNALGTQFDEKVFDASWGADWEVATVREASSWSVEIQLPLASLGLTSQAGETWRANLCRTRPRGGSAEHSQWSCTYVGYHVPSRFGSVGGFSHRDLRPFFKEPTKKVTVTPLPMEAAALDATFEWSYYTGESRARLWVESRLDRETRVTLQLRDCAKGAVIEPVFGDVAEGGRGAGRIAAKASSFVSFDLADLPTGEYAGRVRLLDRKGSVLAETQAPLTKLPPAQTEVKMHRLNRSLRVNGSPLLVYAQGIHGRRGGWWLEDIARHGFNTVIAGCETYRSDAAAAKDQAGARAFLDECVSRGLHVILWLHPGGGPYAPLREGVVRTINALKDHPAIICWYLVDEPEGWWASQDGGKTEADLVDLCAAARTADPYRPAHINWYAWTKGKGGYGSLAATDIGALDRYPVGRGSNAIKATGDIAKIMNDDCRSRRQPTAFWVQMYGYDDAVREPTVDEMAGMTYACLIQGMRLVYYFIYKPMSTELWESMTPLGAELRALAPVLTDPDGRELAVAVDKAGIHYGLWRCRQQFTLAACNASDREARLDLDLKKLGCRPLPRKVTSSGAVGGVRYRRGRLTAVFQPNQRLVLTLE